ncbi:MAG: 3'(2'),5'-bisphosphate nucleotidase CysQ [Bacteroidetes bacterium]|nr:3'(2'),5'-bisphosphate nucleotidase CysQ [Bacteroidota bacterium]
MNFKIGDVCQIAIEAGKKILEIYRDESIDWEVDKKSDNSPLTIADKLANEIICKGLNLLSSQIPIISEENKQVPYLERKDWKLFWLVDPLDGTKEFLKKNGEFTVNIALVEKNVPIWGVVYVPVTDELFYASQGNGAWIKSKEGVKPLNGNKIKDPKSTVRVVCSRSHMNEETKQFLAQFHDCKLISKGSSLKFMLVAEGKADIYPRLGPTMEWDTGAAHAIILEAGGSVLDINANSELSYNKESLLNGYFEVTC